jgi:galactokinase
MNDLARVVDREKISRGIEIINYKTTLPMGKGLSSSAAVTVLVAKAFSQVYDLKLSMAEVMDIAYCGEMLTPSRYLCHFNRVEFYEIELIHHDIM